MAQQGGRRCDGVAPLQIQAGVVVFCDLRSSRPAVWNVASWFGSGPSLTPLDLPWSTQTRSDSSALVRAPFFLRPSRATILLQRRSSPFAGQAAVAGERQWQVIESPQELAVWPDGAQGAVGRARQVSRLELRVIYQVTCLEYCCSTTLQSGHGGCVCHPATVGTAPRAASARRHAGGSAGRRVL